MKLKNFFVNMASGAAIGVAMIIPGVSGGTVAVLINIYDKLIDALGSIRKDFKNSLIFLFPVLLGAVLAFAAMYFPLKIALDFAPFPTVMLFAGFMLGSFPKIFKDGSKFGFDKLNFITVALSFLLVTAFCLIPGTGSAADLSTTMPVWGYISLFAVGAVVSCALVIPGISGSMIMVILGFYAPLLGAISGLETDFWHYALVLFVFAVGLIVGFFSIARLMKYMLWKFPRGTHWAIIGFVLGSIPGIFIVFDYFNAPMDGLQVAAGMILCALGAVATYALTSFAEVRRKPA